MSEITATVKYAMISQPMRGLSEEEIGQTRDAAVKNLQARGYQVLNTYFDSDELPGPLGGNIPMHFLSKSIAIMSKCEAVYFCGNWELARGCRIEHKIAEEYGLKILHESDEDKNTVYADNDPADGGLSYV